MSDITLKPYGSEDPNKGYIAWTPVPLLITKHSSPQNPILRLTSKSLNGGVTKIVFMSSPKDAPQNDITVDFTNVDEQEVYIAGDFQQGQLHNGASPDSKDVAIEASWLDASDIVIDSVELMIRVRKNANELSEKARDDFLTALAKLNGIPVDNTPTPGAGFGVYVTDFVDMHVAGAQQTEHGDAHFLPWHRLYLLDLERLLQEVNPAVTLPYWRFDEPAPNLFDADFFGETTQIPRDTTHAGGAFDPGGSRSPVVQFSASNPLSNWQIRNVNDIRRAARFNPKTEPANGLTQGPQNDFPVRSQRQTLALGGGVVNPSNARLGRLVNGNMTDFIRMEGTPHGAAHVSFNGPINQVPVAPKDPLFFLLHCNVDRLWALWQYIFDRDDKKESKSYPYQSPRDAEVWKIQSSEQWPWDNSQSHPGNLTAPGTRANNFCASPIVTNFSQNVPKINNAIDSYGRHHLSDNIGYAYDDVPYTR